MNEQAMQEFGEMLIRRFEVIAESMQHKMDLVVEGQQGLAEQVGHLDRRVERLEDRMDSLEVKVVALGAKIGAVAADLTAHRRDTEAHSGYRVGE